MSNSTDIVAACHTPGPWRVTNARYGLLLAEVGVDGRALCCAWVRKLKGRKDDSLDRAEPWPEGEANARLIAAAPELLSALQRAEGCIRGLIARAPVRDVPETLAEITSALAKASA